MPFLFVLDESPTTPRNEVHRRLLVTGSQSLVQTHETVLAVAGSPL